MSKWVYRRPFDYSRQNLAISLYEFGALSISFGTQASNDTSGTILTTSGIDTTGYDAAVIFYKHESTATTQTPTDSETNSWTSLTLEDHGTSGLHGQLHWAPLATTNVSHTFTITLGAARDFRDIRIWLIDSGGETVELDVQVTDSSTSNSDPVDAGDLITTEETVSVMGVAGFVPGLTYTPGTGWTEDSDINNNYSQSRHDLAAETLPAECTVSANTDWVAVAAAFRISIAPPVTARPNFLTLLGVG